MQEKQTNLTEAIDITSLLYIIRKNILLFVLIIIFSFVGGYIYLRYTPRTYEANAILQINQEEPEQEQILSVNNVYGDTKLSNLIELIRSIEFQKRILEKLPLNIVYYNKGTFLDNENYQTSPYFVEIRNQLSFIEKQPIFIEFTSDTTGVLNYFINGNNQTFNFQTNNWTQINGCEIYINLTNYETIKNKKDRMYFMIFNNTDAINYHMKGLEVSILSQSANTILITHKSHNAAKSSAIVNELCEDFLKYNVEKKQARAEKILAFIEEQLESIYEKLDDAESKLHEFKSKYNIKGDVFGQKGLINQEQEETIERLKNLEEKYNSLDKIKRQLNQEGNINTSELISFVSDIKSESMIMNFLTAIQTLQKEKETLLINVTENNQKIKAIENQIENQKELLANYINLSNKRLEEEQNSMKAILAEYEMDKNSPKYNEIELSRLMRLYSVHQSFYNQLIEKKAQYLISKAGHVTQNLVLRKSQIDQTPIAPRRSIALGISLIAGLFICCGIIAIKYLLHDEITTVNDVAKYNLVPIAGVIPQTNRVVGQHRFLVENRPDSIFTESFRTLRSNLDFILQKEGSSILAISSTISGEGKTFVAINLGGVIAFSKKKVLLIDMDLRKPKVHISFGLPNDKGMSTLLIKKNNIEECIHPTELENFYVITAGPLPPNPSELANSNEFTELLNELKKQFDLIIIDTPPIGIVADAIYSFKRADYPLYVMRANYSKRNFIYNIDYLKNEKNVNQLSVIINGMDIKSSKYGYSYSNTNKYSSYGYGYGYGYGYYNENEENDNFIKRLFNKKKNA